MITRIEQDEIEGENVYAETWDPSTDQMQAYYRRELELCRGNIAAAKGAFPTGTGTGTGAYGMTHLHSWATALEAVTGIHVQRKEDAHAYKP